MVSCRRRSRRAAAIVRIVQDLRPRTSGARRWISSGFPRLRRIEIAGQPLEIWRPPDMEALIDLAAFEADERIPYWADVWESAIVLAEDLAALDGRGCRCSNSAAGWGCHRSLPPARASP